MSQESERSGILVLHFSSYGTAEQMQKTAETMVKELDVKGFSVGRAILDGKDLVR